MRRIKFREWVEEPIRRSILIIFVAALFDIKTAIQHAVAPNYYLIKSFIK